MRCPGEKRGDQVITGTINTDFRCWMISTSQAGQPPVRTLLDTGFNGAFCLPRQFADEVDLSPIGEATVELGDGTEISEEIFLATSDTALMGMAMLLEKEAVFNLKTMTVRVVS